MENLQGGTLALEHRYHVRQRIGLFGFTTVYHAVQEPFEHPVFISVFDALEQAGAERRLFDRIKSAAQKASTLDAPGILRTLDYGELDLGIPFIIWEQPSAPHTQTLEDFLNIHQTLPPHDVAKLLNQLANVLTPAHNADLPHGSLSTRWILLPNNEPKQAVIGHFQIGLTLREMLAMPSAILNTQMVKPLPPEMFNLNAPQDADESPEKHTQPNSGFTAAADIYALGAIAYEALVGVHPYFDDPTDASDGMIRIKTHPAPELSTLGIDQAISDVVARALARDPAKRWKNVDDFATALASACEPTTQMSTDSPTPKKTPKHNPPIRPRHDLAKIDLSQAISTTNTQNASITEADLHHPHPYLLTTLAAVLLISNLIWFFAYVQQHDPSASQETVTAHPEVPLNTSVLPSGLQLKSNPDGAQIFLLDPDTPQKFTELGSTPYSIIPSLQKNITTVELRKPGFENIRIEISNSHAGQDLELSMIPKK